MKWRCEWCGRPHEKDDPPCEDCGHFKFEPAVAQVVDPDSITETTEWMCEECGRIHPKNSPPCSRCGHMTLEARTVDWDDQLPDADAGGVLDVGRRYIALGIAAVVVAGAGILFRPGSGTLDPPPAPGDADRSNGLDLTDVARGVVEEMNEARRAEDLDPLTDDDDLDAISTYYNRSVVASRFGDREQPADPGSLFRRADRSPPAGAPGLSLVVLGDDGERTIDSYETETALAEALVDRLMAMDVSGEVLVADDRTAVGVDVHVAPDESVFVTVFTA